MQRTILRAFQGGVGIVLRKNPSFNGCCHSSGYFASRLFIAGLFFFIFFTISCCNNFPVTTVTAAFELNMRQFSNMSFDCYYTFIAFAG